MLILSGLYCYPLKSAAGIALEQALLEPRGLQYDRRWMVIDADNTFVSQRSQPRLALIRPQLADTLRLHAPDMPELDVPLAATGSSLSVRVWEDTVTAVTVHPDADAWLSQVLGQAVRLVHLPDSSHRPIDPDYAQTSAHNEVSFADGYAVLVISEASLEDLNSRLEAPLPLTMNRFRPNVVVRGCAPYDEDDWTTLRAGEVQLNLVKPCGRCIVTTTDQETLERSPEPLSTLAMYRKQGSQVMFGQNAVVVTEGWLERGMPLTVSIT
jgi:uncharacterized protein YcbX